MCGRYARDQTLTWSEIHAFSQPMSVRQADDPPPAYNIAPTQPGYVIRLARAEDREAELVEMRWGLLPAWAKSDRLQYSTINARVETVATKPAFRSAWKARRCVIPASGYYEWPTIGGVKRPHYITPASDPMMLFAGIWEPGHRDSQATYSIITCEAADAIRPVHDRMPLMLSPDMLQDWLAGDSGRATELAAAAIPPQLAFHEVSRSVGNVRNQGVELIRPV